MANLATLKAALNAAIYQNNQNSITGEALNTILNSIIDTLGTGYRYAGVATPSANPGTIDNRVFYLATAAGTYTNFGAAVLDGKKLHIFIYDTTWHDIALDVPTTAALAVIAGSGENAVKGKYPSIIASGDGASAIGFSNEEEDITLSATGEGAHAEGDAYGGQIIASGDGAHAEGCATAGAIEASGLGAHAEGNADAGIIASGDGSHAEGYSEAGTIEASGLGAHAEGYAIDTSIIASGDGAHAEGVETIAQNFAEHAEGMRNASHKKTTGTVAEKAAGTTLSSVGCGTGINDRKNAVEVMQNGDVYIKGVGGYDGTNPATPGVKKLQDLIQEVHFSEATCSVTSGSSLDQAEANQDFGKAIGLYCSAANYSHFVHIFDFETSIKIFNIIGDTIAEVLGEANINNVLFFGAYGIQYDDDGNFVVGGFCVIYYDESDTGDYYFFETEV